MGSLPPSRHLVKTSVAPRAGEHASSRLPDLLPGIGGDESKPTVGGKDHPGARIGSGTGDLRPRTGRRRREVLAMRFATNPPYLHLRQCVSTIPGARAVGTTGAERWPQSSRTTA